MVCCDSVATPRFSVASHAQPADDNVKTDMVSEAAPARSVLAACALRSVHCEQKPAYVAVVHARLREPAAAPKRETSGVGSKAIPSPPDTLADSRCARWQSRDPHRQAASSIPGRSREMSLRVRRPDPGPSGFAPWAVLSAHKPRRTSCFTNVAGTSARWITCLVIGQIPSALGAVSQKTYPHVQYARSPDARAGISLRGPRAGHRQYAGRP